MSVSDDHVNGEEGLDPGDEFQDDDYGEPCSHDCDEECDEDGCRHEHCWACGGCGCPGYCDDYQTYNLRDNESDVFEEA
jgi:hypothetical protein